MKPDLYTLIHKAQRQHLFEIAIQIAKCNFTEIEKTTQLKKLITKMTNHLRKHSKSEETFIHPLYQKAREVIETSKSTKLNQSTFVRNYLTKVEEEHNDLDELLNNIDNLASGHNGLALYVAFNQFISIYLSHIHDEEKAQQDILYQYLEDQHLMEAFQAFQKSLTPEEKFGNLEFMLPCLSDAERTMVLSGVKKNLPEQQFQDVMKKLEIKLSEQG